MHTITLDQLRATVHAGGVKGLTLTGQGSGFYLHVATRAGYQAVLVKTRSVEPRRFGNPASALMVMKELGIGVAQVEISRWDPDQQEIAPQKSEVRASVLRGARPAASHVDEPATGVQAAIDGALPSVSPREVLAALEADGLKDKKPPRRRAAH